jgi:hypothetical protein
MLMAGAVRNNALTSMVEITATAIVVLYLFMSHSLL